MQRTKTHLNVPHGINNQNAELYNYIENATSYETG